MKNIEYKCDICFNAYDKAALGTMLLGFRFALSDPVRFEIKPYAETERHICKYCFEGIRNLYESYIRK